MPAPVPSSSTSPLLRFKGHAYFRPRLVMAVLSGRPIRIDSIRPDDEQPGLRDFEAGFLRLLEKVTNGTHVEIGYTGTSLLLRPGSISGGAVAHDCGTSRPVGYFLEWMVPLAPFAKKELALTLKGITTGEGDLGVDLLRTVTLPHLSLFLPPSSSLASPLELRIQARGSAPLGGGSIFFRCPLLPSSGASNGGHAGMLRTLAFTQPGRIRRIRGIAAATRVSPQMANRMVEAARSVLNRYIPDLYIFADVFRGDEAGKSPGFSLSLVSQSTTGAMHASSCTSSPGATPEDTAICAARRLLHQVSGGGCIDSAHQPLVLLLMALGPEDVGRVRLGPLDPNAIQMIRDVQCFFGIAYRLRRLEDERAEGSDEDENDEDDELEDEENEGDGEGSEEGQSPATRKTPFARLLRDEVMVSCRGSGLRGSKKVG